MGKLIWLNDSWEFTERFTEDLFKETCGEALQSVRLPHSCVEMPLHYFDESIYQMLRQNGKGKGCCLLLKELHTVQLYS